MERLEVLTLKMVLFLTLQESISKVFGNEFPNASF
jgi:hypothetical protein